MQEEDDEEAKIDSDYDLESFFALAGGADSDSDEEAPEAANAEEDDSSIRTFTTALLDAANAGGVATENLSSYATVKIENSICLGCDPCCSNLSARNGGGNTKVKTENLSSYAMVKIENSDGTKDGGAQGTGPAGPTAPAGSSVPGFIVKEDATKIFTENIQTSGEESLKREYRTVDMHRSKQIHYDETGC